MDEQNKKITGEGNQRIEEVKKRTSQLLLYGLFALLVLLFIIVGLFFPQMLRFFLLDFQPTNQFSSIKTFILIGLYVGLIPVFLGLLFVPFLKRLTLSWNNFFISITLGILLFLGIETFSDAIELVRTKEHTALGIGLLLLGIALPLLTLFFYKQEYKRKHKQKEEQEEENKQLLLTYLIAIGIGLHNLGEGLAIGSVYASGQLSLGFLLIIGFMIHNLTEGIAITAPIAKTYTSLRNFLKHLFLLSLIAGGPTILGTVIGGFSYSPAVHLFLFAIGVGAIFQVIFELLKYMLTAAEHHLFTVKNGFGFLLGLALMYLTGLLAF